MKTLVFGKNGQIARSLRTFFPEAIFLSHDEANFENRSQVLAAMEKHAPELVINASAYTEVDKAEVEPGRSLAINAEMPGEIAFWCKKNKSSLIHYSTDYVYNGFGENPWTEADSTSPQNRYGATKLAGEQEIVSSGCHHIILRTSWVYSPFGKNFVLTMLKLGQEREQLKVVNDQIGSPTSALDIAKCTAAIARHEQFINQSGVYNLANSGFVSWHGFAKQIFKESQQFGIHLKIQDVLPIPSSDYPTPAKRPLNSRLDTSKIQRQFDIHLQPWREALHECFAQIIKQK